ncbi:migration and invasion-inhibitory protein isoform X5 [Dromiciops gliroides]|uniref:migration and invasion-inhibitory protein isoform X5 n=1 Tax=Dromiciops gliroides TaxID=33562 RepID=UPI001CC4EC27|nr:migration and invasion-inhibitory protein isoform X5 [Dromiciops gliroides]
MGRRGRAPRPALCPARRRLTQELGLLPFVPRKRETPDSTFEMPESEDLTQLREMNLQLLRQLRLGQEEIRKSVAWARGAAQQFPKPRNEEGSSLHTPEAWCSKDKETTVPTEPPRQSVPGPAPGTTTGDEVSEQEQKGSSQEPAPEGIVAAIETVQSVSPAKSPSSSQPQGQESKDYRKPNSRPTLSLPSSPEALGLRPMIDPLMFGVQRSSLETEGLGGLRSNLTTQQWQKFKASQVPPWFGSQSITPKLRWLPTSATLPSGQLPYWPYHKDVRVPDESWRMKPYLGYDVIAGLHCYRVNQRLFTVPLHPRASCPVCKTSRGQKGPETLDRPAQIRVSVPFSTFLPPHQYPIHRRKSFDASDTMALPRHCMMGWDNIPVPAASSSALSSLDLRTSLDPSAQQTEPLSHSRSSKVSSWSWSDPLLSMSRTTQFQLSNFAERYWSGGRRFPRPAVRAHPVPSPAL